jgi:hypothetical protein
MRTPLPDGHDSRTYLAHLRELETQAQSRAARRMGQIAAVKKYWEIIADNLSKAGWSWGCGSAIDSNGRTIWIADAHRGDGATKTLSSRDSKGWQQSREAQLCYAAVAAPQIYCPSAADPAWGHT